MKKPIKIAICITILATAGVGVFFGARAIYESGVTDGRKQESDEISNNVKKLGIAVSEKESFQKSINETFASIPTELNTEGIDGYIEKLNTLIKNTNTESVKNALNEYLAKWQSFKDIYASENNNSISESFNELKVSATDTATKIKTLYDEAIQEAIQNL